MKEQLEAIRRGALEAIAAAQETAGLEALRVKYLGKKGELTAVLKQMGGLSAELRPVMGQLANDVRSRLERPHKQRVQRHVGHARRHRHAQAQRGLLCRHK